MQQVSQSPRFKATKGSFVTCLNLLMTSLVSMKNKILSVGIVGSGFISHNVHLPILNKLENVRINAICDINEDAARKISELYEIPKVYKNFHDMVEKEGLDVVDILTPPNTHAIMAETALKHSCHCLIEKPLATSVSDADRIIKLARDRGLSIRVIHNYSFLPCVRKARGVVSSGRLGKVIDVDIRYMTPLRCERYIDQSHWVHSLPGGVFSDIAPHLAMLLLDFLEECLEVNVMTKKNTQYPYLLADELKVAVNSREALGSFTLSFGSASFRFTIDIVGTEGSLFLDADTNTVVYHKAIGSQSRLRGRTAKGIRALSDINQRISCLSVNALRALRHSKVPSESHAYLIGLSLKDIAIEEKAPVSLEKCREVVSMLERAYSMIDLSNHKSGPAESLV